MFEKETLTGLWKILPYKSQWPGTFDAVDTWISNTFPGINAKIVELSKNDCFIIDRRQGPQDRERRVESVLIKAFRQFNKAGLLIVGRESKQLKSF